MKKEVKILIDEKANMQISLEGMSKWTAVRFLSLHQLWEMGLPGANSKLR